MARRLPPVILFAPWCAALVGAIAMAWWPPQSDAARKPVKVAGCAKDTDCKGARICVRTQCVDPPPGATVAAVAALATIRAAPRDGGTDAAPQQVVLPAIPLPGACPLYRVDRVHSGHSPYRVSSSAPKEIARVATSGVVFSSPAIADDGSAFFGSHDHSVRCAAPDGTVRWTRPTGDLVWSSPALGPGGALYIGSDDDKLHALDATTGAERWTFTAGPCRRATGVGPEAARCDVDGVTIGPDGTIYFAADGAYGLTPEGKLKFRFALRTHCAGAPAVAPDGTIYLGCQDGALYALGPDGAKRWEFRTGGDIDSSPAVGSDGTVYFGSDDDKLYAVTPGGALRWAVQTRGDVHSSPAIATDGTIYAGSFDGGLYAVRPDGTVAWTFRAADRILSSPTIDGAGLILIGSQDDRLYAVNPDGTLAWSVLLDGDVDGTPAIGPGGTIYVGADDKALHILR